MARLQYTIEDDIKKQAEMIFREQGITPKVAIKMFYIETIKKKSVPFKPSKAHIPNAETLKALEDSDNGVGLTVCKNLDDM